MWLLMTLSTVWAAPPHTLAFDPIAHELPDDHPYGVSPAATLDGRPEPIRFQEILRAGDQPGTSPVPFGQLATTTGAMFSPGRPSSVAAGLTPYGWSSGSSCAIGSNASV